MADLQITIGSEFTGAKAFKKAETASDKLGKSVMTLAKTLGVTFGAAALGRFGKSAVTAFLADEKAAAQLNNTMKNLNLELSAPGIGKFIEQLSLATGVTDDQLRPAMQTLLQTTGSVTQSQKLLTQALDASASTGIGLSTVATDLAQAYVGNLKGLRKYNLGLTQAELKAASFADIQKLITQRFGGAQKAALDTYTGQMKILSTTAGEAKEIIGKGLVDALIAVGGEQASVQGTADAMTSLATGIADISLGFGTLMDKLVSTPIIGDLLKATGWILGNTGPLGVLRKLGEETRLAKQAAAMPSGTVGSAIARGAELDRIKAEKDALKRARELMKAQAAQTKALKDAAMLKKQGAIFDMQQIQIVAALKKNISEEERTKLELQSALLMGNTSEATRLIKELAGAQGLTQELRTWLLTLPTAKNPFEAWMSYLDGIQKKAAQVLDESTAAVIANVQARMNNISALQARVDAKIQANKEEEVSSVQARIAEIAAAQAKVNAKIAGNNYSNLVGTEVPGGAYGFTNPDGSAVNINISLDGQMFNNAVVSAVQGANRAGINTSGSASG